MFPKTAWGQCEKLRSSRTSLLIPHLPTFERTSLFVVQGQNQPSSGNKSRINSWKRPARLACAPKRAEHHLAFASGFAISCAHWMKCRATGLTVRCVKVMIATGRGWIGNSTASTLTAKRNGP